MITIKLTKPDAKTQAEKLLESGGECNNLEVLEEVVTIARQRGMGNGDIEFVRDTRVSQRWINLGSSSFDLRKMGIALKDGIELRPLWDTGEEMSNPDNKMARDAVLPVAELIVSRLKCCCLNPVIAGSLRREKPFVSDVEIVLAYRSRPGMFEDEVDYDSVEAELLRMQNEGLMRPDLVVKRDGKSYKRFLIPSLNNFPLDLFLAEEGNYGAILLIRTGPHEFSKRMMTNESFGGCMPFGMAQKDGWLWRYGEKVPTPTEEDYFRELGMAWIEPKERNL